MRNVGDIFREYEWERAGSNFLEFRPKDFMKEGEDWKNVALAIKIKAKEIWPIRIRLVLDESSYKFPSKGNEPTDQDALSPTNYQTGSMYILYSASEVVIRRSYWEREYVWKSRAANRKQFRPISKTME